ncbi:MAG: hypothetical protein ACJAV5_001466 [Vicingaceae bacterium]|jgi:hypothetical protein
MKDLKKNNNPRNEQMRKILTITLFIGIVACQQSTVDNNYSSTENKIDAEEIKAANLSEETPTQIIEGYLKIKDALVNTDAVKAAFAAESILFDLEQNENKVVNQLLKEVKLIAANKDVEKQRIYFEGLSHNIYMLAKNSVTDIGLYQQYCPMAFDNTGAYWISDQEEVYNRHTPSKSTTKGHEYSYNTALE